MVLSISFLPKEELKSVQKILSLEDFDLFCDALDQEGLRNSTKDKYGYVFHEDSAT